MLSTRALELVKEYKRTKESFHPINDEAIRQVIEESKILYEENQNDVESVINSSAPLDPAIRLRHNVILQNKRCLLAYLYNRLGDLRELRWAFGSVLPPDIKLTLSEKEISWFNGYSKLVANYMSSMDGIDLMQNITPPKSLFILVRCLTDHGELVLDDGTSVILTKHSTHLLKRKNCEKLIRLGILEHIHETT